jgi:hypothetical protein
VSISAITSDNQQEIQNKVEEVKQRFGGDIVAIRYDLDTDWVGDPAIHFRILLPDAVANNDDRLGDVTERVRNELVDELSLPESGRFPYFNFRSQSGQAELKDPEWD